MLLVLFGALLFAGMLVLISCVLAAHGSAWPSSSAFPQTRTELRRDLHIGLRSYTEYLP